MKLKLRIEWKNLASLAAILIVVVGSICLLVARMQKRQRYVGTRDPSTGYRCRFDVSSDWKTNTPAEGSGWTYMGDVSFTAPPPTALHRWIDSRLLHRNTPEQARIYLYPISVKNYPLGLKNGYPRAVSFFQARTVVYRHLRVDGCPATLCELEAKYGGKLIRATLLYVYAPAPATIYVIYGLPEVATSDQVYREIEAISTSFHVERVAVPGKSSQ